VVGKACQTSRCLEVDLPGLATPDSNRFDLDGFDLVGQQHVHQSVVRSPPAGLVEVQLAAVSEIARGCPLLQRNAFQPALQEVEQPQPVVPNGLSLCKIHHAAYDRGIVGVRADYVVEVRPDVLLEIDGPMLRHGIQDVHGWTLELPKRVADRPERELLAARWKTFSR